jgi:osmotically-inducible protein OsmY
MNLSEGLTMTRATGTATRRPDAEIFAEARTALDQHAIIPATVRVHVDKGIATLTGTVRLASESSAAEEIVRQVRGVDRVANEITIAQAPSEQGFEPPDRLE